MPALETTASQLVELAQRFDNVDQKRLALGREVKKLEDEASGLKAVLIEQIEKAGGMAVGCSTAVFTIKHEFEPQITSWSDLRDHIVATGEWEFLEKRVNKTSVKERWTNDVAVPGVAKFPVTKLSRSGVK